MTAQVMFRGPLPDQGEKWCVVCFMSAKAATVNSPQGQDAIRQAQKLEPDDEVWVDLLPGIKLYPAVVRGVYLPLVQAQLIAAPHDLCWSHGMGVSFKESRIMPADAAALSGGNGNIPLLGQG